MRGALTILTGGAILTVCAACSDQTIGPDIPQLDLPILFSQGDLFLASPDGQSSVMLTDDTTRTVLYSEWSPTGEHILIWARSGGPRDLFVLDADGSNPVQISNVPGDVAGYPAWSPDGSRVAFRNAVHDLFVVSRDGAGQIELTPGSSNAYDPHWSPDGGWIAFDGSGPEGSGIYRVRPDGSERELIVDLGSTYDRVVRYAPGGARIAFEDGQDLYLVDADGGLPLPLTETPSEGDWFPRWSPDGTQLAFHTDGGTHWAIAVMDVSSREIVETFGHPDIDALYPYWAPDGRRITFQIQYSVQVRTLGTDPGWTFIDSGRYPSWHPGG